MRFCLVYFEHPLFLLKLVILQCFSNNKLLIAIMKKGFYYDFKVALTLLCPDFTVSHLKAMKPCQFEARDRARAPPHAPRRIYGRY